MSSSLNTRSPVPLPSKAAQLLYGKDKNKMFDRLGVSEREFKMAAAHPVKAIQQLGMFDGPPVQLIQSPTNRRATHNGAFTLKEREKDIEKAIERDLSVAGPDSERWDFRSISSVERSKALAAANNRPETAGATSPKGGATRLKSYTSSSLYSQSGRDSEDEQQTENETNNNEEMSTLPGMNRPSSVSRVASFSQSVSAAGARSMSFRDVQQSNQQQQRVSSKAQDVLFGGHKNDPSKIHDKLGLSQKEFETFEKAPRAFAKLGVQHFQTHAAPAPIIANVEHKEKEKETRSRDADSQAESSPLPSVGVSSSLSHGIPHKAQDLLYGGMKSQGKQLDRLGIHLAENERFEKAGKAYNKLGAFESADILHQQRRSAREAAEELAQEKAKASQNAADSPSDSPLLAASAPASHAPLSKKASDLMFGGAKNQTKQSDKLGISDRELKEFADRPKAYLNLGVYQKQPPINAAESAAAMQRTSISSQSEIGGRRASGSQPQSQSSSLTGFTEPLKAKNRLDPLPNPKSPPMAIQTTFISSPIGSPSSAFRPVVGSSVAPILPASELSAKSISGSSSTAGPSDVNLGMKSVSPEPVSVDLDVYGDVLSVSSGPPRFVRGESESINESTLRNSAVDLDFTMNDNALAPAPGLGSVKPRRVNFAESSSDRDSGPAQPSAAVPRSLPPPVFKRAQSKFSAFPVLQSPSASIASESPPPPVLSPPSGSAPAAPSFIRAVSIRPPSAAVTPALPSPMAPAFLGFSGSAAPVLSRDTAATSSSSTLAVQSTTQKPNRPPLMARAKTKFINRSQTAGGGGSGSGSGMATPVDMEIGGFVPSPPSLSSPQSQSQRSALARASRPKLG